MIGKNGGMDDFISRVKADLQGVGRPGAVAAATGISVKTLYNLRYGTRSPRYETAMKLRAYYDALDASERLANIQQAAWTPPAKQMG